MKNYGLTKKEILYLLHEYNIKSIEELPKILREEILKGLGYNGK